jgi:hypothetical protein
MPMDRSEHGSMRACVPVFVDDSGSRRRLTRFVCRLIPIGVVAYLTLLGAGLVGDPRLSEPGLPALVVAPPTAGGSLVGTSPIPESFAAATRASTPPTPMVPTSPSTTSPPSRPHTID